jgi:transcriptional regulator with XRE-family HTH domain
MNENASVRRREFGDFLRSRRERLLPGSVGLSAGLRRRTPGLRREEVALLAGVGTTWYTWLEQGRDVRASSEVLAALAEALRLSDTERRHLFTLSDQAVPDPQPTGPEGVEESVGRMLSSLHTQPAYVLGRRWDVLGWNRAAEVVFCDYARLRGDERNIMHILFANAAHRRLLVDWDDVAPASLAMFRADSAKYTGDPDFERLIATLTNVSVEFREWWPRHNVLRRLAGHKRLAHPSAGSMIFEFTSFAFDDGSDRKFVVYTPLAGEDTVAKVEELLGRKKTPHALEASR